MGHASVIDKEVNELLEREKIKQKYSLQLIASENYASKAVLELVSSCLTVIYCDAYPSLDDKYSVEALAQRRCLDAFNLNSVNWGVNVRPLSGSTANFAVFAALLGQSGKILAMHMHDGGHASHGYLNNSKKVTVSSIYFDTQAYHVNKDTGEIDYDELQQLARSFKPNIIVAGGSCYSHSIDFKRFREICDEVNAILMADVAHIAGLIAAGAVPSPFDYADVINTTTHKSLRGPRGALIFFRKGVKGVDNSGNKIHYNFEEKINQMIYPGFYGGAHSNVMAAIAVAMKEIKSDEFKQYAHQIIKNSQELCKILIDKGYKIFGGVTSTHVFLIDVRPLGVTGAKVETLFDKIGLLVNKMICPGETNSSNTFGIRIGTSAITSRNTTENDMKLIAEFIDEGMQLAIEINKSCECGTIEEFLNLMKQDEFLSQVNSLHDKVQKFAGGLPIPGFYD